MQEILVIVLLGFLVIWVTAINLLVVFVGSHAVCEFKEDRKLLKEQSWLYEEKDLSPTKVLLKNLLLFAVVVLVAAVVDGFGWWLVKQLPEPGEIEKGDYLLFLLSGFVLGVLLFYRVVCSILDHPPKI